MKNIVAVILIFLSLFYFTDIYAKILNGKILVVNDKNNFVVINLGKDDKIKKGTVFLVYREKKLLGKIKVEEVFKDMSSCNILSWIEKCEFKRDDGVMKP